ncbi:MAG: YgcG family protein [Methylococcales bacterium]|nr:YgcG family protein [Methylococcales bacterium]
MIINLRYTVGIILLLFMTTLWAEVAIPNLSQRVTDLTGTLTAEQITALESKLADFESQKGSQIAVLLLPTTQPEDIAAYSIRVADAWKIGRKNVDDGLIMIIAKDDHRSRLEVGRGLEGVIPDAIAKRVLAETMKPYFKNEDYAGGIDAGVTQLIGLIQGETLPAPTANTSDEGFDTFLIILFFCCVVVDLLFSSLLGSGIGAVASSIGIGAISAGVASFLALDIGVAVFMGIGMYFFLKLFYMGGGGSGGSWSGGGGGSSSSSWGGGGGGFSGGGASDSW